MIGWLTRLVKYYKMSYIDNCKKYRQTIIDNFEDAQCIENVITKDMIDDLVMYQFNNARRVKWTGSSRNIQPIVNIDAMIPRLPKLQGLFKDIIGDYYSHHTGNFYITTQLHDAHADLLSEDECKSQGWTNNVIPYKSVIIPLLMDTEKPQFTSFFKQRHIGYSVTFDKVNYTSQDNSMYKLASEYPEFYEYGNLELNIEMHNPQIPKKNVEDFTYQNAFEFKPGNIMVFDSCQIHMSTVWEWIEEDQISLMKNGINIQFYKEV